MNYRRIPRAKSIETRQRFARTPITRGETERVSKRSALFVDRDGTIIADTHYLSDADRVRLLEGAASALSRANAAGVAVVVVTNQSGIARGLISPSQYEGVRLRMENLLQASGATIDATFHCPHLPEISGPCNCRKPALGMYEMAAEALDLDLARSAYIGDKWRDVMPALSTGGMGVLVAGGETPASDIDEARSHRSDNIGVAVTLDDAVTIALRKIEVGWSSATAPSRPRKIGVLASGGGSNLQALIDHFSGPARASGEISWVGSNQTHAKALERARDAGIPADVVSGIDDGSSILTAAERAGVDLLVLAGYLKQVPAAVVKEFKGRMINIHPALLPSFGGAGMYGQRIHASVLSAGLKITGVTVHWVDEEFDRGAVIAQWPVQVKPADTAAILAARVLATEHRIYPLVVEAVATGGITLSPGGMTAGEVEGLNADFALLLPK